MGDTQSIVNWITNLGGTAVLVLGIVAVARGWLVLGREMRDCLKRECSEREERLKAEGRLEASEEKLSAAREQLARATALAEKAVEIARGKETGTGARK